MLIGGGGSGAGARVPGRRGAGRLGCDGPPRPTARPRGPSRGRLAARAAAPRAHGHDRAGGARHRDAGRRSLPGAGREYGTLAVGALGDLVCWPQEGVQFAGALVDRVEAWLRCGPTAARHTVWPGGCCAGRALTFGGVRRNCAGTPPRRPGPGPGHVAARRALGVALCALRVVAVIRRRRGCRAARGSSGSLGQPGTPSDPLISRGRSSRWSGTTRAPAPSWPGGRPPPVTRTKAVGRRGQQGLHLGEAGRVGHDDQRPARHAPGRRASPVAAGAASSAATSAAVIRRPAARAAALGSASSSPSGTAQPRAAGGSPARPPGHAPFQVADRPPATPPRVASARSSCEVEVPAMPASAVPNAPTSELLCPSSLLVMAATPALGQRYETQVTAGVARCSRSVWGVGVRPRANVGSGFHRSVERGPAVPGALELEEAVRLGHEHQAVPQLAGRLAPGGGGDDRPNRALPRILTTGVPTSRPTSSTPRDALLIASSKSADSAAAARDAGRPASSSASVSTAGSSRRPGCGTGADRRVQRAEHARARPPAASAHTRPAPRLGHPLHLLLAQPLALVLYQVQVGEGHLRQSPVTGRTFSTSASSGR